MMKASLPDRGRKHRTEPVPPVPNHLVADVDAPLEQNILDLSQRQRIADIHHHHETDHLGRAVEITEGIAHRRRLRILARRLKPIYSDNAPHRIPVSTLRRSISFIGLLLVSEHVRRSDGVATVAWVSIQRGISVGSWRGTPFLSWRNSDIAS